VPSEYVVGWARTGAKGLIGSHRSGSADVVARMLEDWRSGTVGPLEPPPRETVDELLARRGVAVVGFSDWKRLDDVVVARGAARGAPREKVADVQAMLDLLADPGRPIE
jgi:ferredoxin--NADP+ reductase